MDFLEDQYRRVPSMVNSDTKSDVASTASPDSPIQQRNDNLAPEQKVMAVFDSRPFNAQDIYLEFLDLINFTVPSGSNMILRKVRGNSYSDAQATVPIIVPTGLRLNVLVNAVNKVLSDQNYGLSSVFDADVFTTIKEGDTLTGSVSSVGQLLNAQINSWVPGVGATGVEIDRMAYGNGVYIGINTAIGNGAAMSADGATWVPCPMPIPGALVDIKFGNGVFIALNQSVPATAAYKSVDGINWSVVPLPSLGAGYNALAFGGGVWVAVNAVDSSYSINNGVSWVNTPNAVPGTDLFRSMGYGLGVFVLVGTLHGIILTSPDGVAWTQRAALAGLGSPSGVAASPVMMITTGQNALARTTDGVNWVSVPLPGGHVQTGPYGQSVAYGNGMWKLSALGTTGYTSADGNIWTLEPVVVQNSECVAFGKKFVTTPTANAVSASYDSRTLQQVSAGGLVMKYAIYGQLIPSAGKQDNQAVFG